MFKLKREQNKAKFECLITKRFQERVLRIPYRTENSPNSSSKFIAGSKAKGATRSNFTRWQLDKKPITRQSRGSLFADGFMVKSNLPVDPSVNGHGLFGQFIILFSPNLYNPRCLGDPRSITILSSYQN